MTSTPHFDLPFRFSSSGVAVVEQDTLDDLANCVEAILRYPRGFRPERPDFGIDEMTFKQQPVDLEDAKVQIATYEPRATANIFGAIDQLDTLIERVTAEVSGGTRNA